MSWRDELKEIKILEHAPYSPEAVAIRYKRWTKLGFFERLLNKSEISKFQNIYQSSTGVFLFLYNYLTDSEKDKFYVYCLNPTHYDKKLIE